MFAWAGELRTVDISRGSDLFCFAHHIGVQLDGRTAKLRADPRLDSDALPAFAAAASEHINELNAIHTFREGNGRTMRLLLVHLAERAGFEFRIARIDHEQWMHGSIEGFRHQNYAPLADVIARATDSPECERTRTRTRRR